MTPVGLRKKAADYARAAVDRQSASFRRYGVWGDFDRPYLTLEPEYEAAQIEVWYEYAVNCHLQSCVLQGERELWVGRYVGPLSLRIVEGISVFFYLCVACRTVWPWILHPY